MILFPKPVYVELVLIVNEFLGLKKELYLWQA